LAFIDREAEIQFLLEREGSNKAELIVVYGRRRVGKTELLKEAFKKEKAIFFVADLGADQDQRRRLSETIGGLYPNPLLQSEPPPEWDPLLRYLAGLAKKERIILILDEFPYLCSSQPALPSILQRIWDEIGKNSRLYLILCGSFVSFMEREILATRARCTGAGPGSYGYSHCR
jgi:AAA+ ATPase superfamily predicted ATPase